MLWKSFLLLFVFAFILYAQDKTVYTKFEQSDHRIDVYLVNTNLFHITCKVDLTFTSKKHNDSKNILKSFNYNSKTKIASFPLSEGKYKIASHYKWSLGTMDAVHTSNYLYRLPYAINTIQTVTQGFNGKATHHGESQYAVDFDLKKGTKVYAARDGIVVKIKEDSSKVGKTKSFARFSNYITLRQPDNTYATYGHLKKNGVVVKVGDKVSRGQHIGYSGNTGYSTGEHLHFVVYKSKDHEKRYSLPMKFISNGTTINNPLKGHKYKATN